MNKPSARAPFLLLLPILASAFVHVDDLDALLYTRMARGLIEAGDWWRIHWTATQLRDFHDHLPPPIWLIAALEAVLGAVGTRLAFAGFVVLAWALFLRLARRFDCEREATLGLWAVVLTESYLRVQGSPRIDQPLLLVVVSAVAVVRAGTGARAAAAGAIAGLALVLRFPIGLFLLALVPCAVVAERLRTGEPLAGRRDPARFFAFVVTAAVPCLLLHLGDLTYGEGRAWSGYLEGQVLSSLTGARVDGRASHLSPLLSVLNRFWPGLPFLVGGALAGTVQLRRAIRGPSGAWRPLAPRAAFLALCAVWAAGLLVGLGIGHRHIPHHVWPCYPALACLSGFGMARAAEWSRCGPRTRVWLGRAGLLACVMVAALLPFLLGSNNCDLAEAGARLPLDRFCDRVLVASRSGDPIWQAGTRVVDHWDRDVEFVALERVEPGACPRLLVAPVGLVPRAGWTPLHLGRRYSVYSVERMPRAGQHGNERGEPETK